MWILTAKDADLPLKYLGKPMKLQPSPLKILPCVPPRATATVAVPRLSLRVTTEDAIFYQVSLPKPPDTLKKLKMLQPGLLTMQYLPRRTLDKLKMLHPPACKKMQSHPEPPGPGEISIPQEVLPPFYIPAKKSSPHSAKTC
ncbi:hypothetical protein EDB89DRAFT_2070243 [Lactarius sanguifluus]|nr:hypothetical protein EDB89DRAFT_2070243 [Lactarius sanguifluus]